MVQAIIDISDETNRVLNIVKARYELKDKSEAINKMAQQYEEAFEPEIRPEYLKKLLRGSKEPSISMSDEQWKQWKQRVEAKIAKEDAKTRKKKS